MSSIAFLLGILAFIYIVFWSVRNDHVSSKEEQRGLLRMKTNTPDENTDK